MTKMGRGPRVTLHPETELRLERAFDEARADAATDVELGRLADRLAAVLPAGTVATHGASGSAAPPAVVGTGKGLYGTLGKVVAALAVAGGVGFGVERWIVPAGRGGEAPGTAIVSAAAEPEATSSPPVATTTVGPVDPPSSERAAPAPAVRSGSARPKELPRATSASAPAPKEREIASPPMEVALPEHALLLEARRRVASEPLVALSLVDEHGRRFPKSDLTQERELIAIDALITLGRGDEARARASQFRRRFPGSAHLPRLQALEHRLDP
jgi:hypothetical protein